MPDVRIKDITTTSTAVLADDWTVTDGLTNGTRKIQPAIMVGTAQALRAVPTSPADTGIKGEVAFDADYEYRCVLTSTWRRWPISEWS